MRLTALCLALLTWGGSAGGSAIANCTQGDGNWIVQACYDKPETYLPYGHNILGDTPEWTRLRVTLGPKGLARLEHDQGEIAMGTLDAPKQIIEDVAPRIVQINGKGPPEIVMVVTDHRKGAKLVVLDIATRHSVSTPYIGTRHRWLAPLGAADLDGDGHIEIAYIDRPHLTKTLRIWRFENTTLSHVADQPGLTNHRIGEDHISGGIRICTDQPEIITTNATWTRLIASTLSNGRINTRDIGPYTDPTSFTAALACN